VITSWHGLELCHCINRVAPAVGRHRHAVFDECDAPSREDHVEQWRLLETQMAVPSQGHENVGAEQQQDGQQMEMLKGMIGQALWSERLEATAI
jgi:hypothetical protein